MKFTKLRLNGASSVELPLEGVGPLSPYVLKAADGLGPPQLDVAMGRPLSGKGYFQSRRPQLREIVLRIGLQPEWNIGQTPQELRTELYGLLTPKFGYLLGIEIIDGNTTIAVSGGHVRNFEIAPFSKDPEVQITIACDQSYLMGPNFLSQAPSRAVSGNTSSFTVNNPGTAPTGFTASFQFKAAQSGVIRLSDEAVNGESIGVSQNVAIDDVIIFSTTPGDRGIWFKPAASSTATSILGGIEQDSEWIQLHNGDNVLRLNHPNFVWFAGGVTFKPAYWGV